MKMCLFFCNERNTESKEEKDICKEAIKTLKINY